ncbi:MAG: helix-turn-helix domain-containing protein [Bacteroidota bacterium]
MEKKTDSNQQLFIECIKQSLPSSHSLVDELSDLLELSTDSAYRRIRGETAFTLDEIIKICNIYRISFDSFCSQESGSVNFNYSLLSDNQSDMVEYLQRILTDMKAIDHAKEKEIIYAAEDIPIFHLFKFPELASFKIFYWMKSVMNVPGLEGKKYNASLLPEEIFNIGSQILELYKRNPSTEIWNDRTISSIIKQIDYYHEAGMFSKKEDSIHLCEVLSAALDDIQMQAEKTTKADVAGFEGNFILYSTDIELGNNCILVNVQGIKRLYLRHHTFNNMITTNSAFCNETEQWLKGIMKKSTLISGVSEKQRNRYFMKAQEQVSQLKLRLG